MTSKKRVSSGSTPKTPKTSRSVEEAIQALQIAPDQADAPTSARQSHILPSLTKGLLTPLEWRFAQEYVVDLNATQAYLRANPKCAEITGRTEGSRLLANPYVVQEVRRLMDERARKTGVTAERVFLHAWDLATADARELSEVIIGCCRHCWGLYGQYQYTEAELELSRDKHLKECQKKAKAEGRTFDPDETPFHEKGGSGFDRRRPPNPECPECAGEGQPRPVLKDTRHLSPGAAAMFDGIAVKRGKFGEVTVNIKTQDRAAYLTLVARHLGMLTDKIKLVDEADNPLLALIRQIQGAHAPLAVVHNDPERGGATLPMADVVDVTARPVPPAPAAPAPKPRKEWKAAR